MRNVLLLLVTPLTCVLANVCSNNGARGSIFVCRNASLDDLRYIPRYARSIKFVNSNIKTIPANAFAKFYELRSLNLVNCSINNVESFAFKGLSQLRSLNLSQNAVSRLRNNVFYGLNSLNRLDLTINIIEVIEDESFVNVSNIELLDLRYNNLTGIEVAVLRPLSSASTLDVRFNKLQCISSEVFNDTRLKWFYIGDNPWDENCWANLTKCLYIGGIYYGKNLAFDTLMNDRLIWNNFYQEGHELLSEEQAEEKVHILKEAEGWKSFYETVVQEIADERQRREDLSMTTEEAKKSEDKSHEEDTESGLLHYGRALVVWVLTVCNVFLINPVTNGN